MPGEAGHLSGAKLTVVPQPAVGVTRLVIDLPSGVILSGGAELGLYDASGRKVLDLSGSYEQSGYVGAQFDAKGLSSGLYVCRLTAGKYSTTLGVVMITK